MTEALAQTSDNNPILEIENLQVSLPTPDGLLHAVQDLNLCISRGETLCIVGESGCGKSMTSLAIMGLLPRAAEINAQKITFRSQNLLDLDEAAMSDLRGNQISMIFQEPMTSLNPVFTIGNQLVETILRHRKVSKKQAINRAIELLELVGISGADRRMAQYPYQLSGGLRQRVMIAMSLMCEPELIIADEPTTALDVTIQAQILGLLAQIQRELGTALILITHDLGVVARIADTVAVMYAGQIVEQGHSAKVIFENPLHPYTQGLLRCIPLPGKTRRGTALGTIPGMVPNLVGSFQGCRFMERCEFSSQACRMDVKLQDREPGHSVRCTLTIEEMKMAQANNVKGMKQS